MKCVVGILVVDDNWCGNEGIVADVAPVSFFVEGELSVFFIIGIDIFKGLL